MYVKACASVWEGEEWWCGHFLEEDNLPTDASFTRPERVSSDQILNMIAARFYIGWGLALSQRELVEVWVGGADECKCIYNS